MTLIMWLKHAVGWDLFLIDSVDDTKIMLKLKGKHTSYPEKINASS